MFEQLFMKKNQDYGCIYEWCDCISATSEKQSILKTPQLCKNCMEIAATYSELSY